MRRDVLVGKTPAVIGGGTLDAPLAVVDSVKALVFLRLGSRIEGRHARRTGRRHSGATPVERPGEDAEGSHSRAD